MSNNKNTAPVPVGYGTNRQNLIIDPAYRDEVITPEKRRNMRKRYEAAMKAYAEYEASQKSK